MEIQPCDPMLTALTIATRKSPLALRQADLVRGRLLELYAGVDITLLKLQTQGDRFLDTSLGGVGGKGLFVKELEQALLDGAADLAVHSMKDVPVDLPEGLAISVVLKREDPRDALVSPHYAHLDELPSGARIGTSSMRRQSQLRALRPDLTVGELRGNIGTRLARLDRGEFDALLLAAAGLRRLNLQARIASLLDPALILPAIGQGAIGVECRADDTRVLDLLRPLDDPESHTCIRAERGLNRRLGGGCHAPIACLAEMSTDILSLRGLVARIDGTQLIREESHGPASEPERLGTALADQLCARGAAEILRSSIDAAG
ncbi:MAG: hydroxymethylbilane synthase [Gammaproteobacteria bacterium]